MEWNVVFSIFIGLLTGVVLTLVSTYISTNMNLRATTRAANARSRMELEQKARLEQEAKAFEMRLSALCEFRDTFSDMVSHLRLVVSRVLDVERLSALEKNTEEAWRIVNVEYAMFVRKNALVVMALHKTGDAQLEGYVTKAGETVSEVGRLILGRAPYEQLSEKATSLYPLARKCVLRVDEVLDALTTAPIGSHRASTGSTA